MNIDVKSDSLGDRKLKNVFRVLSYLVVFEPARHLVVSRLEVGVSFLLGCDTEKNAFDTISPLQGWWNNQSVVRNTRELVTKLASCCTLDTQMEEETMKRIIMMKVKPHATQYQACFPLRSD